MKKRLLCAAALFAAAMPATANAATGYVDLSYGRSDVEDAGDTDVVSFGGAFNFDLAPDIEAQADAHWARIDGDADPVTLEQGAFHIFHRNDVYSYGFVASIEDLSSLGGQVYDLGIEGQYFSRRATIDASVSFANLDTLSEDAVRYKLGMTVFPLDNLSFGGGGQRLELADGGEIDVYSADLEYQPGEGRTSFFASYRASDDNLFTSDDADTVALGVRLNFGDQTLFERNRSGVGRRTGGTLVGGVF
jgi:hypothetical protein